MPVVRHAPTLLCAAALLALTVAAGPGARAATDDAREIERLFRSGDTTKALSRADAAIRLRPSDAGLRFTKGVMLTELQRTAEAADVFEALTQEFPDLPEPYNNLAVLLAGQGRIDRARDLLETALRHDPAYLTAHENLGDVYVRLAQRAYERITTAGRADAALDRKLRLARELTGSLR
jgi:Flp pilus assembly protein TadD